MPVDWTAVENAVLSYDLVRLRTLLEAHPESFSDIKIREILKTAISITEDKGILDYLFGKGVPVTTGHDVPAPPLLGFAKTLDMVKYLVEKGANVNDMPPSLKGGSVLELMTRRKDIDIVEFLLEKGADPNLGERLPLITACAVQTRRLVSLLLSKGADPNKANKDGITALESAFLSSRATQPIGEQIAGLLIGAGADVNKDPELIFMLYKNGKFDAVKYLMRKGATASLDALFLAATRPSDVAFLKFMIEEDEVKSNIDLIEPKKNRTLLHVATLYGNLEAVKMLLEIGADILAKDADGKTPADLANEAKKNKEEMIAFFRSVTGKYKGKTIAEIKMFDPMLAIPEYREGMTADEKKLAEETAMKYARDTSLCPVCMDYTQRTMGCLYMRHKCDPERRHDELYSRYADEEKLITWCTDCGRICHSSVGDRGVSHNHYELSSYNSPLNPELIPSKNPFSPTCTPEGGGSIDEKIKRIDRLVAFLAELQTLVGTDDAPTDKEARDMLIEEMWNGPFIRVLKNPLTTKKWRTDLSVFPTERESDEQVETPIVIPPGSYEEPVIHQNMPCTISMEDEEIHPAIQFRHKNKDGVIYDHTVGEEKYFICRGELYDRIRTFEVDDPGKCYDTENCKGYLWPPEVRRAFELFGDITPDEERAIKQYEERFPRRVGGGKREAILPLNTLFTAMTDGKCSLPPKDTFSRGKGRRTYKKSRLSTKVKRTQKRH